MASRSTIAYTGEIGSGLVAGSALLGPMSRRMKDQEALSYATALGYPPTCVRVAFDGIRIIVHHDNPIPSVRVAQLRTAYSSSSGDRELPWGAVGLDGEWSARPVHCYGRNMALSAYWFVRERVLAGREFRRDVAEQPGSAAVAQAVRHDVQGIGYIGLGIASDDVRILPVAEGRSPPAEASDENVRGGRYPLARPLYIYFRKDPRQGAEPLAREFLEFVLSAPGQEIAKSCGLLSLSESMSAEEVTRLGASR